MFATLRWTCPMRVSGFITRFVCSSVSIPVTSYLGLTALLILPPTPADVYEQDTRKRHHAPDNREEGRDLAKPEPGDDVCHHRDDVEEARGPRGGQSGEGVGVGNVGDGGREDAEVHHSERGAQRSGPNLGEETRQVDQREQCTSP